jgi:CIC family chloride channel protein
MNWPAWLARTRERILPREKPLSLAHLSLLGGVVGAMAGLAIAALHGLIQAATHGLLFAQEHWQNWGGSETRIFLTTASGGVLLGLLYSLFKPRHRHGGFVHIIERLTYHQGQFPARNLWLQIMGTVLATTSHQAVGREGAAAHMGAAAGSWLGRRLDVPTASLRALVGCGAAAGISASFNTPLAGVIFIMEVIVVEYSVAKLAPSIVAAVCANAVAHLWLQSHPALIATDSGLLSMAELPYLALMGVLLGLLARLYLDLAAQATSRLRRWPIWVGMSLVGIITALGAVAVNDLVDNGFAVINRALAGELELQVAASLGGLMLLCSALGIAAGLPGGVIMPCMLIGACVGLVFGEWSSILGQAPASDPGVYALLGLGGMVAAVLQAPLTALVLLVELSARTGILLPAMLVVVTAVVVARGDTAGLSVFTLVLRNRGLDYRNDPVSQSLRRISVMAAMNRSIARAPTQMALGDARALLNRHPDWIIVQQDNGTRFALAASDLLHACNAKDSEGAEAKAGEDTPRRIDLSKIPAERHQLASIHLRASLQEAWDALKEQTADALCVEKSTHNNQTTIYGVLTPEAIDRAYRA